jgi:hypothetical protein
MLDSEKAHNRVGFSTGALERGDYRKAMQWLVASHVPHVELSALRYAELEPLVGDLDSLPLAGFRYVSFHAPSAFRPEDEEHVVELLEKVRSRGWNIIVHPDVIRRPELWRRFGRQLLIENMDRRKSVGRTASELEKIFKELPGARLCLDLAHARQLDTTLTLLSRIIRQFSHRIAQVHISELDSKCQHFPMTLPAVNDYQHIAKGLESSLPVIIESMLDSDCASLRLDELELANEALTTNGNGH